MENIAYRARTFFIVLNLADSYCFISVRDLPIGPKETLINLSKLVRSMAEMIWTTFAKR